MIPLSKDRHSVAKREEAVFFPYRRFIDGQDFFPSRQTGNEHNQGAFRQVEIGNQPVHTFHFIGWIEENFRVPLTSAYKTVLPSRRERTRRAVFKKRS